MKMFIKKEQKGCWKDIKSRELANGFAMKFSCSEDFSLAFLDVLDYQRKITDWNGFESKDFPLEIFFSGDSSFLNPL